MALLTSLPLNATLSFDVYPASVLGTDFTYVKILAHLDSDSARFFIDPQAVHNNVYPFLPEGQVPDDPSEYTFVKIKLANGNVTVIGAPWIIEDSIEKADSSTLRITVNGVTTDDRERIIKALAGIGHKTAKVEFV